MFKKVETVDAVPLFHQIADYREKKAKKNLINSCELQVIKVYKSAVERSSQQTTKHNSVGITGA